MPSVALEVRPTLGRSGADYVFIARNSTTLTLYDVLVGDAQKALSSLAQMTKKSKKKNQYG